jgi:glycosyltransferase involved in cell wall biosynthesis
MPHSASRLLSINNYFYPRGGAEVVFLEHNRLFEGIGWEVVPFAMRHPNNLPSAWAEYFPDEIEFGRSYGAAGNLLRAQRVIYSLQARRNIGRLLDAARPRIAHAHNVYHHLSPSIFPLLKQRGVPVVMSVHDLKLTCPSRTMMVGAQPCERCRGGRLHHVVLNRCIKGSLALSTLVMMESAVHRALGLYEANVERFVVPSHFVLETMVRWGWARERLVYVPNFADIERFRPGADAGGRFVYCGRLDNTKGVATLLRAAAIARQPVTLVGSGPDEPQLRELATRSQADVVFAGHQSGETLAAALRSARAVVVPSEVYENAPLAVLESYAAGRPVIGARIGGIPELVREDETGALFPSGDAPALAAALARFAQFPTSRLTAMGAAGRRWVEQDFSATIYRDRMLDLYGALMGASP